jgi:hypothetical protein
MASFGFMVIRGVFAVAEHLAPRLTGRAAFELFSRTPDPKKLSPGEREALAGRRRRHVGRVRRGGQQYRLLGDC